MVLYIYIYIYIIIIIISKQLDIKLGPFIPKKN